MSEPTYRIETTFDAVNERWQAQGYSIATGLYVSGSTVSDPIQQFAAKKCADLLVRIIGHPGKTFYATEHGEIVPDPEPQSLRA